MQDYLLRRAATSETMNPSPYFSIIAFVLLLLLFSNHCCFHLSCVTCPSLGMAELTTPLRRPLSILWLPLSRINKLCYTTREDRCDHLHLWVIRYQRAKRPRGTTSGSTSGSSRCASTVLLQEEQYHLCHNGTTAGQKTEEQPV